MLGLVSSASLAKNENVGDKDGREDSRPDHRLFLQSAKADGEILAEEEQSKWRSLTEAELNIMEWLLSTEFTGRSELLQQLNGAQVVPIEAEGSLRFRVQGPLAPCRRRVPAEAYYFDGRDDFGPAVRLLIHVVEGRLYELEVYKDDGTEILLPFAEVEGTHPRWAALRTFCESVVLSLWTGIRTVSGHS